MCKKVAMQVRMAPKDPLNKCILTIQQFSFTSLPERWNHCVTQFYYNHLYISFLNQAHNTRVAETGQFNVIYLYQTRGASSSNLTSKLLTVYGFFLIQLIIILQIYILLMINISKLLVACTIITLVCGLRQSDLGNNDWSRENIGKVKQISFPILNTLAQQNKNIRQTRNIFFHSDLGLFGHLNRKTGEIISRESLGEEERVIESDEKQLVILTDNGQIVRYNKITMHRTVDNKLFTHQNKEIHSYVRANNKIYLADDKFIRQFDSSLKRVDQISSIAAPVDTVYLKIFSKGKSQANSILAMTYSEQKSQMCINEVVGGGLIEKKCSITKLQSKIYVKVFESTGNIYYGDQSKHYYTNFITFDEKQFNSKPISFFSSSVRLQNGLTFNSKISEDKILGVESNRHDKHYLGQVSSGFLKIYETNDQNAKGNQVAAIQLTNKQFKVNTIWLNFITQSEIQIIVQFQDLQLVLFALHGKTYQQQWSREESLAYIQKVLFMKYEGYADHLNNPYHMKMDDPSYIKLSLLQKITQFPINLISRVKAQVQDVYNFIIEKVENIIKTFTDPAQIKQLLNINKYIKSTMSEDSEKKYGLRKYIIVITSFNTMYSIDTKTSTIIWKKKYGNEVKLVTLIKLKQQYEKQVAIAINYKYHITYITQIHEDGTFTELQQYQTFAQPSVHKISPHSIIIRANQMVHRYDINKQLLGEQKQYNFYSIQNDRRVQGWKIINQQLIQTWVMEVPNSETIIKSTPVYKGQPKANLPLVNDKKVLFKNVDFSNLAVLTIEKYEHQTQQGVKTGHRLHVYMINGLTGTIQFSQYQTGVNPSLPISMVYDEHNALVTYYNTRNRVYQIWSIESFQVPQQSQLISKKYEPFFQKEDIIFRSKVFGTVLPIKNLYISESKQALLKRNLIIITRENKLYLLPRQFVSTRRPKSSDAEANANSGQAEFTTSKYPPEDYILPLNTFGFVNHQNKMASLSHIRFSTSDLESTIFMMAYGIDIFLIRTAPDRPFDLLADGFNYVQLVVIMVGVTIASLFFKSKVKQAKLRKPHLD